MSFVVAIDGPAASGKGTIGRALAEAFGFAYLDTGLLYRAVGLRHLAGEDPVAVARGLSPSNVSPERLRGPEVAQAASRVAAIPEVRAALVDYQRAFAGRIGGAVLDVWPPQHDQCPSPIIDPDERSVCPRASPILGVSSPGADSYYR